MIVYLELDDLLALTGRGGFTVGDYGLLNSALARPAATTFGEDAYPTFHEKAAALFQSLAANHALLDGNKRTSLVIAVASGQLSAVGEMAQTLGGSVERRPA